MHDNTDGKPLELLLPLLALRSAHRHTAEDPHLLAPAPKHRMLAPKRYAPVELEPRTAEEAQHARLEQVPLGLVCCASHQFSAQDGDDNGEGQRPGHSRSGSAHSSRSAKQLPPVPTSPSNFVPLKNLGSSGHNHLHKKAHSHSHSHSHSSSSKSRPSSPRKATDIDDAMTVPLNPHET